MEADEPTKKRPRTAQAELLFKNEKEKEFKTEKKKEFCSLITCFKAMHTGYNFWPDNPEVKSLDRDCQVAAKEMLGQLVGHKFIASDKPAWVRMEMLLNKLLALAGSPFSLDEQCIRMLCPNLFPDSPRGLHNVFYGHYLVTWFGEEFNQRLIDLTRTAAVVATQRKPILDRVAPPPAPPAAPAAAIAPPAPPPALLAQPAQLPVPAPPAAAAAAMLVVEAGAQAAAEEVAQLRAQLEAAAQEAVQLRAQLDETRQAAAREVAQLSAQLRTAVLAKEMALDESKTLHQDNLNKDQVLEEKDALLAEITTKSRELAGCFDSADRMNTNLLHKLLEQNDSLTSKVKTFEIIDCEYDDPQAVPAWARAAHAQEKPPSVEEINAMLAAGVEDAKRALQIRRSVFSYFVSLASRDVARPEAALSYD